MGTEELQKLVKEAPSKEKYEKCVEFCRSHDFSFQDKLVKEIYFSAVIYLMNYKISHFTEDDAKILINFFCKLHAATFNLDKSIDVKILTEEEYRNTYKDNSNAICVRNDDTHTISYSPKVVTQLISGNPVSILRGMQTIFHEVIHVLQNNTIYNNGIHAELLEPRLSIYTQIVETIVRRVDPKFYNTNYSKIYKENHAEYYGLKTAMDYIKKFNTRLYDTYKQDVINEILEEYKASMKSSVTVFGKEGSHLKTMDPALCIYIEKHPEALEEFPALGVAFNKDGKKKSITELLQDRRSKFDKYEERENLDNLYEALCIDQNVVAGGQKGTKAQLKELVEYMMNGFDDFEYGILEKKLTHKDIPQETKNQLLQMMEKYRLPSGGPNPMGM